MNQGQEYVMRDSYTGQGMPEQEGVVRTSQNGVTTTTYQTTTQPAVTTYTTSTAYTPGIATTTNIIGGQPGGYRSSQIYTSQYQPAVGTTVVNQSNIRTGTPTRQVYETTTQVTQPVRTTTTTSYQTSGWQQAGVGSSIVRQSQAG